VTAGASPTLRETSPREAPFLSVTVLNYNYAHYLPQCLDSILAQTMTDFEVLVINDKSSDNSLEVLQPYLKDPRVVLIDHQENAGFVRSLREGCERSRGRFISVVSADDYVWDKEAFALARQVLDANPDVTLCYSAWYQVDGHGKLGYERRSADHDYVVDGLDELRRLVLSSSILHTGTIMRRDAYEKVGGYDLHCRYAIDNNMWLAICTTGKVAYIDRHLYAYRQHETNMSNSAGAFWQTIEEMLRGIDDALALVPDAAMPDKEKQRRIGKSRALVAVPTHDIFAGRYRRGWSGYWLASRRYPALTLLQPRTLTCLARTLLGSRLFEWVRKLRGERNSLGRAIRS
jgi:glycosyltransferase involved in cell wall biosynthesis